jgi:hypothetical protein
MKKKIKKYRQDIIKDLRSLTFAQKRKVLKQGTFSDKKNRLY